MTQAGNSSNAFDPRQTADSSLNQRLHAKLYRRKRSAAPLYESMSRWLCLARHNQILFHHREYLNKIQILHDQKKISDADVRQKANELVARETQRMVEAEQHLLQQVDGKEVFNVEAMHRMLWNHREFETAQISGELHAAMAHHQLFLYFDCNSYTDRTVYRYNIVFTSEKHALRFYYDLLLVKDFRSIVPNSPLLGGSGLRYVGLSHTDQDVIKLKYLVENVFNAPSQILTTWKRDRAARRIFWFWCRTTSSLTGVKRLTQLRASCGIQLACSSTTDSIAPTTPALSNCSSESSCKKKNGNRKKVKRMKKREARNQLREAAKTVQALWRGRQLRMQLKLHNAATCIQQSWHGRQFRFQLKYRIAVKKIQATWRGKLARLHVGVVRVCIITLQRWWKTTHHQIIRKRLYMRQIAERAAAESLHSNIQLCSLLSQDILDFFHAIQPNTIRIRDMAAQVLYNIELVVKHVIPFATIEPYGSFTTGLSLPSSDIDLVLSLEQTRGSRFKGWRNSIPQTVSNIGIATHQCHQRSTTRNWFDNIRHFCLELAPTEPDDPDDLLFWLVKELKCQSWVRQIRAVGSSQMPVFKLMCNVPNSAMTIKVDITLWNPRHTGPRATKLVREMMLMHPTLQPLVIVLKQLLHENRLNNAYRGGLSSYALTVMVICFLRSHYAQRGNQDVGSQLLSVLELYGEPEFFRTFGVSIERGLYEIGTLEERQAELQEPTMIEDPLNPWSNLGKLSFRISEVQAVFRGALRDISNTDREIENGTLKSPLRRALKTKWGDKSRAELRKGFISMKQDC